ncbi:HSP20-like chaperone, partial [Anaeromyces robustus]
YNPFNSLERKIEKVTDKDVFKLVDFCPKINIIEDNDKYYIQAELPGMTKNEIKIEISKDRIITISGERKSIKESDNKKNGKNKYGKRNKKYSKVECSYGKFERSFNIPENVDLNNIKAKMENGVLEVTFDKIESTKNK